MTAAFAAALIIVADLAWATAITTTGPWFSGSLSLQVYSIGLIASTILAFGLVLAGSLHVASIGNGIATVDRRIATLRGVARSESPGSSSLPVDRDIEDELDEILGEMERGVGGGLVEVTTQPRESVVEAPRVSAAQAVRGILRELVSERVAMRSTLARVRWSVAGPIAAAIVFGGISAAMLPASEGFAATNFQLNTFLILFLSYGWPVLVAWSATAVAISRRTEPP